MKCFRLSDECSYPAMTFPAFALDEGHSAITWEPENVVFI